MPVWIPIPDVEHRPFLAPIVLGRRSCALSSVSWESRRPRVCVFPSSDNESHFLLERIMQIGKKKLALDHLIVQSMENEAENSEDVQSILLYGAKALFEESSEQNDIHCQYRPYLTPYIVD